ncbi:hypothetical protein EGY25_13885 [Brevundimonas intermedia]|uniref:Uncharacterized protein n=1 Tax=Brevundimonas intermedia TaxID=74315 RepID=A0A4Y9RVR8_9CAUL|nr:hypothetical protein [Brevundimonas intermedia]TFW13052.1 hypothetical protein EGY25_13885 [Brevundimonas intermedia]
MTEVTEMYSEIAVAIAVWNSLESDFIELLGALSSDPYAIAVISVRVGSESVCESLRSLARDRVDEPLVSHVDQATKAFSILREYRNQFVHRVTCVIPGDPPRAFTYARRAKNGLEIDRGELTLADLSRWQEGMKNLSHYVTWISSQVTWHRNALDDPPQAFRAKASEVDLMDLPMPLNRPWIAWDAE